MRCFRMWWIWSGYLLTTILAIVGWMPTRSNCDRTTIKEGETTQPCHAMFSCTYMGNWGNWWVSCFDLLDTVPRPTLIPAWSACGWQRIPFSVLKVGRCLQHEVTLAQILLDGRSAAQIYLVQSSHANNISFSTRFSPKTLFSIILDTWLQYTIDIIRTEPTTPLTWPGLGGWNLSSTETPVRKHFPSCVMQAWNGHPNNHFEAMSQSLEKLGNQSAKF